MAWIASIDAGDPTGFWVNVLAGVPFLFFDLVIITMLLPITIQWWDELHWEKTRLTAINHLLDRYYDEGNAALKALLQYEVISSRPAEKPLTIASVRRNTEQLFDDRLRHMELEIQTALPILGSRLSEEILVFHYGWRTIMHHAKKGVFTSGEANIDKKAHSRLVKRHICRYHLELAIEEGDRVAIMYRTLRLRFAYSGTQLQYMLGRSLLLPLYRINAFIKHPTVIHDCDEIEWSPDQQATISASTHLYRKRLSDAPGALMYRRRHIWQRWLKPARIPLNYNAPVPRH